MGTPSTGASITPAQRAAARMVGALYLLQMATGVFGQSFVRGRLIVSGNPAKTAENILGAERLFRLSIAGDLFTYATVIVLAWGLYVLLRPVSSPLAVLAVFFRVAENAVLCAATSGSLVVLRLLDGTRPIDGLDPSHARSLAYVVLSAQGLAMNVAFVLLGFGSAVFAYLLLKSRYVPRWLAAWGVFASLVLSLVTLADIAFPSLDVLGLAYMAPMGLYEVGLGLWLLVRGV